MQVKSIAECSKSTLQYIRPSLSYHFLISPLFCLFLSGRLKQSDSSLPQLDKCVSRRGTQSYTPKSGPNKTPITHTMGVTTNTMVSVSIVAILEWTAVTEGSVYLTGRNFALSR